MGNDLSVCNDSRSHLGTLFPCEFRTRDPERNCGVGINFQKSTENGSTILRILSFLPGSPAEKCQLLQPGDVLHSIDDHIVVGAELQEVAPIFVGPRGSSVKIGVRRGDLNVITTVVLRREVFGPQQQENALLSVHSSLKENLHSEFPEERSKPLLFQSDHNIEGSRGHRAFTRSDSLSDSPPVIQIQNKTGIIPTTGTSDKTSPSVGSITPSIRSLGNSERGPSPLPSSSASVRWRVVIEVMRAENLPSHPGCSSSARAMCSVCVLEQDAVDLQILKEQCAQIHVAPAGIRLDDPWFDSECDVLLTPAQGHTRCDQSIEKATWNENIVLRSTHPSVDTMRAMQQGLFNVMTPSEGLPLTGQTLVAVAAVDCVETGGQGKRCGQVVIPDIKAGSTISDCFCLQDGNRCQVFGTDGSPSLLHLCISHMQVWDGGNPRAYHTDTKRAVSNRNGMDPAALNGMGRSGADAVALNFGTSAQPASTSVAQKETQSGGLNERVTSIQPSLRTSSCSEGCVPVGVPRLVLLKRGVSGDVGLRLQLNQFGSPTVASVVKGSYADQSAEQLQVHQGDSIYSVDRQLTASKSLEDISKMLFGRAGTDVTLLVIKQE